MPVASTIEESERQEAPAVRLIAGMKWAQDEGIRVVAESENHGVHCVSGEPPRWERDPRQPGPDPLGAAVLRAQPDTDDLCVAVELATGLKIPEIEGWSAGLRKQEPDQDWLRRRNFTERLISKLYLRGLEHGAITRAYLHGRQLAGATATTQGPREGSA